MGPILGGGSHRAPASRRGRQGSPKLPLPRERARYPHLHRRSRAADDHRRSLMLRARAPRHARESDGSAADGVIATTHSLAADREKGLAEQPTGKGVRDSTDFASAPARAIKFA